MQKYADYIKQIEIDSLWSGTKHILWNLDRRVNILSGVNGVGKSTILNKVVKGLSAGGEFPSHLLKGVHLKVEPEEAKWIRFDVIRSVDRNIGRVLKYLEEKGLLENTLVVYTSDQGFYMGEHGWFDKRFMYEESMHTPLLMHLPKGLKAKGEIREMVQNIDYAPTFLELAGIPVPEDMHGVSLLPLLRGEHPVDWRKALYYHFYEYPAEHMVKRHYGVRTDRFKLIHFYNDIDTWELYDLKEDPTEMHNLYGNSDYASIVDSLKETMLELQEQYNDPVRFSPERDRD